jgi:nucleotide-binding universal stress UspA family protein
LIRLLSKILVPIDGSEYSFKALNYAIILAKKFNSAIHVIHVIQMIAPISYTTDITGISMMADGRWQWTMMDHLEANGRRILATAETKTTEEGITAFTNLIMGSPAEEILKYADKHTIDLIVVGGRGHGSVARFFLGSVSTQVSRYAKSPVLVVKTE